MRFIYIYLIVFLNAFYTITISCQGVDVAKNIDLNLINRESPGMIDIPIKNNSTKDVFIFRLDVDDRYKIKFSSKLIKPDSVSYIRLWYYPKKKGTVNEKVALHLSCYDNPIYLNIKGFVVETPKTSIECPSFKIEKANSGKLDFQLSIIVLDSITNEKIHEASVVLIKDGMVKHELQTQKNGKTSIKTPLGLYYFVCLKEGYTTHEEVQYVNRNNNQLVFKLQKIDTLPNDLLSFDNADSLLFDEQNEIELILNDDTLLSNNLTIPEKKDTSEFSINKYAPNNIVFLLDVSSSMKYTGKLELLKASMYELTELLREVDQISIVTYSSQAKVLLETISTSEKDTIKKVIENIQAKGLTAGGRGLKLAYKNAHKNYIENGNNQVIIATDGDFNEGEENIKRLVRKYKRKGITLSVIGIKNTPFIKIIMQDLAKKGGGNFIPVNSYDDALQSLVNEIKENSYIPFNK